jgi:hypothetical protein
VGIEEKAVARGHAWWQSLEKCGWQWGPCVYLARHMLIKAPVPDSNAVRLVSRVPDVVLCENEVPHEAV